MPHTPVKTSKRSIRKSRFVTLSIGLAITVALVTSVALTAPLPGAIFTTDVNCNGTDLNIYAAKTDVYVDGGPAHPGAAGLPPGEYYIQVTEPNGDLLGTSIGTTDETPIVVNANGEFVQCYQLFSIVRSEEHTSEFQSQSNLVCRLLLEKKKKTNSNIVYMYSSSLY